MAAVAARVAAWLAADAGRSPSPTADGAPTSMVQLPFSTWSRVDAPVVR